MGEEGPISEALHHGGWGMRPKVYDIHLGPKATVNSVGAQHFTFYVHFLNSLPELVLQPSYSLDCEHPESVFSLMIYSRC